MGLLLQFARHDGLSRFDGLAAPKRLVNCGRFVFQERADDIDLSLASGEHYAAREI
jgi:hypothetical protein